MNALVVLLMTASTAADPVPVVQAPAAPAPTYTYTVPDSAGTTEEGRPRLFSRLRRLFRRGSQPSDPQPTTVYPAPSGATAPNVWGTMPPAGSASSAATSPGSSAAPILRPVPAAPLPETAPARRLPSGSPF